MQFRLQLSQRFDILRIVPYNRSVRTFVHIYAKYFDDSNEALHFIRRFDSFMKQIGYRWARWPVSYGDRSMLISIGRDLDGMNLVVGRAMHMGDTLPAKVKPDHGVAYVCHEGTEHTKHHFEVLMPAHFNWIRSSHGHVPEHAVEAGTTRNGEMLYVGRTFHNGVPCVGKVHRSHGVMYIPFDGKEIPYREYEVLVQY